MKEPILLSLSGALFLALTSWGPEGHSTVALIAQNHLTPKAQAAVDSILGGKPMSSISSWADDYRDTDKTTAGWHFLNLNLGLSQDQFRNATIAQKTANVYNQLNRLIKELSTTNDANTKARDLKFIVHFVGDAHQPMHVSQAKDRGGNTIQITFLGKNTNLHSLWDSGLLNDDQKDFSKLAAKVDKATPAQIQQWQNDDIVQWLWESYQTSSIQYANVHQGSVLDQSYADTNIPIAEQRLEMGGIRLAGLLNKIFK